MKRNVLVTPLDWGIGHATRMIPVVHELISRGHQVSLASAGDAKILLEKEFPALPSYELPPYNPSYRSDNMIINMISQIARFMKVIGKEHVRIEQLVDELKIDVVISDNRYGCWSEKATSIVVTHQLNILTPASLSWANSMINAYNRRLISKFDHCWVPDFEDHQLSGRLSESSHFNSVTFVGPLSRYGKKEQDVPAKYFTLVLLSGPEPQRTYLEKDLVDQLNRLEQPCCIVRGLFRKDIPKPFSKHQIIDFEGGEELRQLIAQASVVISRPGYSTIMDLATLSKKAIFIPTPGQTEQEYLAEKFTDERVAPSAKQRSVNLGELLQQVDRFGGFAKHEFDLKLLASAMKEVSL